MADSGSAKKPARKRAPTAKTAAPRKRPAAAAKAPVVAEAAPRRRRRRLLLLAAALVVAAAAVAGALLFLRGEDASPLDVRAGVPVVVSAGELAAYVDATDASVYWAGPLDGRSIELTTTSAGTFVRYLPPGAEAGDDDRALTIATYPLANAFATVTARARSAEWASASTRDRGLAVWSGERPTSVYLAFPGVGHLIEIYSPDPNEPRRLARSGRVVAVR